MFRRVLLLLLASFWLMAGRGSAQGISADGQLIYVLILSRNGVRAPLRPNSALAPFAAEPWPSWKEEPGELTAHGRRQMVGMGSYYRENYSAAGLISGDSRRDAAAIYWRSDKDSRSKESARALSEGLAPGSRARIRSVPAQDEDPLLCAAYPHWGNPDLRLGEAAIRGQIGGDLELLVDENRPALDALDRILLGDAPPRPGPMRVRDLPASLDPAQGCLGMAWALADPILMEYADGRPMGEVGWGRLRHEDIPRLTALVSGHFIGRRTRYLAQVEASGLASHLLATFTQAAQGTAVRGALGSAGDKMAVLLGHDDNIVALAALLGAQWHLPQSAPGITMPGGALVFELRRRNGTAWVRTECVAQTYDQIRSGETPNLMRPPAVAPIFVPDCGTDLPGFDAPLSQFSAHLSAAIDPRFVARMQPD